MSWEEDSASPEGHRQLEEDCGTNSVDSLTSSQSRGCRVDLIDERHLSVSSEDGKILGSTVSSVSPSGHSSRRNKRKQSEPRRLSTSLAHVVKEEPADDGPDYQADQGRLTTAELDIRSDDSYRYGGGRATMHGQSSRLHLGGMFDSIPTGILSLLQGHTSRASNTSEESLDLAPVPKSSRHSPHSTPAPFGTEVGGMDSDDAKSDIDDPDAAGSHGTCADSPELLMNEEGDEGRDCASPDLGSTSPRTPSRSKKTSRSYKNLSRSRRIVANARERNRVHTISAAFEGLRRAVPSYSHNQKLSKLAILRIACSYILALASLADMDYSPDQQQMSFGDCVEMCTKTLQSEGRSKRRKVPME